MAEVAVRCAARARPSRHAYARAGWEAPPRTPHGARPTRRFPADPLRLARPHHKPNASCRSSSPGASPSRRTAARTASGSSAVYVARSPRPRATRAPAPEQPLVAASPTCRASRSRHGGRTVRHRHDRAAGATLFVGFPPEMTTPERLATPADAGPLFVQRLQAVVPDPHLSINASTIARICRHLDGIRCAIEASPRRARAFFRRARCPRGWTSSSMCCGATRVIFPSATGPFAR